MSCGDLSIKEVNQCDCQQLAIDKDSKKMDKLYEGKAVIETHQSAVVTRMVVEHGTAP
jgi:hypothetical protein